MFVLSDELKEITKKKIQQKIQKKTLGPTKTGTRGLEARTCVCMCVYVCVCVCVYVCVKDVSTN
jgi:hypothetical protein